jgi:hypothetical protein
MAVRIFNLCLLCAATSSGEPQGLFEKSGAREQTSAATRNRKVRCVRRVSRILLRPANICSIFSYPDSPPVRVNSGLIRKSNK